MSKYKSDPEKYREMSKPYLSKDSAGDAINAFLDDVRALREKHRIAEIVVGAGTYYTKDDKNVLASSWFQNGDAVRGFLILENIRPELAITAARAAVFFELTKEPNADEG